MSRRNFLRNTGITAAGLPLASAILAACGGTASTGNTGSDADKAAGQRVLEDPARPDHPITLPINDQSMIADGLKPEAGPLELYNWEEYINPRVVGMFEDAYNVKVNVNTFNTMDEGIATITTTADAEYDVFVTDVDRLGKLAAGGLVRPLNHTYLANLSNTWDRFHTDTPDLPWYDVGAHYSVPYTTYTTGVAWRIDLDPSLKEDTVSSMDNPWEVLWDPAYKGKVHILDDMREVFAMVLLKNGITDVNLDDESTCAANLQKVQDELLALVQAVDVKADISDYSDLPEGISHIHHGWSGDFLAAKWYFPKEIEDRDVIRYWTPEVNEPVGNDLFTIPTSGKNPVLAHAFLNFMLDHDNSLVNFQWNGYVPPQRDVTPDDLLVGSGQYGAIVLPGLENAINTEDEFAKGTVQAELIPSVNSQMQDVWEAFQTGSGG